MSFILSSIYKNYKKAIAVTIETILCSNSISNATSAKSTSEASTQKPITKNTTKVDIQKSDQKPSNSANKEI